MTSCPLSAARTTREVSLRNSVNVACMSVKYTFFTPPQGFWRLVTGFTFSAAKRRSAAKSGPEFRRKNLNRSQRRERRETWAGKTLYPLSCRSLFPSFASVEKELNRRQRRERRETWAGEGLYPLCCRSLFPSFASVEKKLNRSQRRERRETWAGKTLYPLSCRSLFPPFASVGKNLNRSQRRERRETWAGKTLYPLSCRSLFPPFASVGKNLNRSQRRERRYFHPLFYLLSCVEIPPCMPYSLKQIN